MASSSFLDVFVCLKGSQSMTQLSLAFGLARVVVLEFYIIQVRIAADALTMTC